MVNEDSWSHKNDTDRQVVIYLEPHGAQVSLKPGSTIVVKAWGGPGRPGGSFEIETGDHSFTVWLERPGGFMAAFVDGDEVL